MPALVISNVERPSAEVSVVAVYDRRNSSRLSGHRPPLRFTPLPLVKSCTEETALLDYLRHLRRHHFLPIAVTAFAI